MSKEGPLDTLIHTIYETALDAGRWASALQQLAGYLAAAACHFMVWNKRANAVSFSVLTGAPPEAAGSYGAYYASIDPLLQLVMSQSPGAWLRCHEHFDENFVRRNEFYQDYLAPYGRTSTAGRAAAVPGAAHRARLAHLSQARRMTSRSWAS